MNRLEELQLMCVQYSFEDLDCFSNLLNAASTVFPGIDREIAKLFSTSLDTVLLWKDGSIIPDNLTQSDIVRFIHNKSRDYREAEKLEAPSSTSMIVYDSRVPATYIPDRLPFFQPATSYVRSMWNSIKSFFLYWGCISKESRQFDS